MNQGMARCASEIVAADRLAPAVRSLWYTRPVATDAEPCRSAGRDKHHD